MFVFPIAYRRVEASSPTRVRVFGLRHHDGLFYQQPMMLNAATDGKSWADRGIRLSQILGRNKNTAKGSEVLWEYAKENFLQPNLEKGRIVKDVPLNG